MMTQRLSPPIHETIQESVSLQEEKLCPAMMAGDITPPQNGLIRRERRLRDLPREASLDDENDEARCFATTQMTTALPRQKNIRSTSPQHKDIPDPYWSTPRGGIPSLVPARFNDSIQRGYASMVSEMSLPDFEVSEDEKQQQRSRKEGGDDGFYLCCEMDPAEDSPGKCILRSRNLRTLLPREFSIDLDDEEEENDNGSGSDEDDNNAVNGDCCEQQRDESSSDLATAGLRQRGMLLREENFFRIPGVPSTPPPRRVFRFAI